MRVKSTHAVPALLIFISLLLIIVSNIFTNIENGDKYLIYIVSQIIIFAFPTIIYCSFMKKNDAIDFKFNSIKANHIFTIIFALLFIIACEITINILLFKISPSLINFTSIEVESNPSNQTILYLILSYGILPAITEEILFRSVILSEYKKYSIFTAVFMSSLLFALIHLNIAKFPTCFITGIILALVVLATDSIISTIIIHTLYNVATIFINIYLPSLLKSTSTNLTILLITAIVVALVSLVILFGEFSGMYKLYARTKKSSSSQIIKTTNHPIVESIVNPTFLLFIIFYFIYIIVKS